MKIPPNPFSRTFLWLLTPLLCCTFIPPAGATEAGTSVVRRRLEQFYRDAEASDLEAMMALYAPDALILRNGQPPVVGRAAIRRWWQEIFAGSQLKARPEFDEVEQFGDAVVLRGRVRGTLMSKVGGELVPVDSWFLQIYRWREGAWEFWRGSSGTNPSPEK